MEHVALEIAFLTMIGIYLLSSLFQKTLKIPLPHSLILLSYTIYYFKPELLNIHATENFDSIIFFLIPVILMYDAMHLKWKDIKTYKWSIGYLAIFSVTVSIVLGSLLFHFGIFGAGLTIGMYVALFSMNMATDAISVSNIFSQFKGVPHNIKVLVEGESLGNDATAMVAFYFIGLPWILNGTFDLSTIPFIAIKVFGLSTLIGLSIGILGFLMLRKFNLFKEELLIILGVAYLTFSGAEIIHASGILALIIGVITFTTLVDLSITEENAQVKINPENKKALFKFLKKETTTKTNQKNIMNTLDTFSFMAVILVFVSMASMINVSNLMHYWKEILIMFIATSIIRFVVMAKFVLVGKATKAIDYVGTKGWVILTLAGIKGSLSIIMLHAIPKTFEFYELFESVTIGVILLSTFIYGILLLIYMSNLEKEV